MKTSHTLLSFTIMLSLSLFASDMETSKLAIARESMYRQTGGFVEQKSEGKILIINCQKKVSEDMIIERMNHFYDSTHYRLSLHSIPSFSCKDAPNIIKSFNAVSAVFILDDENLPFSLIALEESWGLLNVSHFIQPDTDKKVIEKRFKKAFVRTAGMTFGGILPQHKGIKNPPVVDGVSLEKYPMNGYGVDGIQAITKLLTAKGITKSRRTVYIVACREGWAPAPTNDIQKAIWDKVHAAPKNPIKIEFDPKKGR